MHNAHDRPKPHDYKEADTHQRDQERTGLEEKNTITETLICGKEENKRPTLANDYYACFHIWEKFSLSILKKMFFSNEKL